MIQFDEDEHLECAVSDMTFRFFDRQYKRMESEKLLYPKPREVPVGERHGANKEERFVGVTSDNWSDTA